MSQDTKIDESRFLELWEKGYSCTIIQEKLNISRYMINRLVEKNKLKERPEIIIRDRSPDQKWTEDKITRFMQVYKTDGGSIKAASEFGVSKQYAPVLAQRFRRKGY